MDSNFKKKNPLHARYSQESSLPLAIAYIPHPPTPIALHCSHTLGFLLAFSSHDSIASRPFSLPFSLARPPARPGLVLRASSPARPSRFVASRRRERVRGSYVPCTLAREPAGIAPRHRTPPRTCAWRGWTTQQGGSASETRTPTGAPVMRCVPDCPSAVVCRCFFFLSFPRLPDEISCLFPLAGDPPSRGFRSPLNRGRRSVAETEPIWLVGWFGCFRVTFFSCGNANAFLSSGNFIFFRVKHR